MLLPTTLCLTAAAIVVNFWLGVRISKLRYPLGISVGDGGNEALIRRMRAQANFMENTPLTLILVAAVELAGQGGAWLAPAGAVFILGRIAHGIGMDGPFKAGRPIGMLTTYLLQLALIGVGVLASIGKL
ncbi:MAG: MAPEG family protein [Novosphingobium sp.]